MSKNQVFSLEELAEALGADAEGELPGTLSNVAPLETAGPDDLSFLHQKKYLAKAKTSRAGAIIAPRDVAFFGTPLLRHSNPYEAFAGALSLFYPQKKPQSGIHSAAIVDPSARVDETAHVGPGAVIGADCDIGPGVVIHAHCVLMEKVNIGQDSLLYPRVTCYSGTQVGRDCILHSGVVLGADGFGFAPTAKGLIKVPQVGHVEVEDRVEIGANTTIDRATLERTVIGAGSKIDNLVMVAHNVRLGNHCILVAQSGIAGSTVLEDGVMVAGQSGTVGHINVGKGAKIAAKTAVTKNVPAGQMVSGSPAVEHGRWLKAQALFLKLPDFFRRLKKLEKCIESDLDSEQNDPPGG